MRGKVKKVFADIGIAILAGVIVSLAYFFFQNSNGFAPGGVGGLATITYYLTGYKVPWGVLMLAFNLPIMLLVTIFVDRKLGLYLMLYLGVQSGCNELWGILKFKPYCLANNPEDFEIMFACIATGIISGIGFSLMLRRFGASGGTYAISALIKKAKPAANLAYLSFILDSTVVAIAFFVYGRHINPVICTLLNLFIANVVVDFALAGARNGYRFEIITDKPQELSERLMKELGRGVTEIQVHGMYSDTDKYML
ncbi:MAG: YitT family protein, partial [Clostridiales bacterium]|nr:YitT family protein [Clostridiales bacterium]